VEAFNNSRVKGFSLKGILMAIGFLLESKVKNHCHCLTFYKYAKMETFEKFKYRASNPMSHAQ